LEAYFKNDIDNINFVQGNILDLLLQRILVYNFNVYIELSEYIDYIRYLKYEINNSKNPIHNNIAHIILDLKDYLINYPKITTIYEIENHIIMLFAELCDILKYFINSQQININLYLLGKSKDDVDIIGNRVVLKNNSIISDLDFNFILPKFVNSDLSITRNMVKKYEQY